MKKGLTVILVLILLSGCSAMGDLVESGASINDEAIYSAWFVTCKGASVGAVRRNFGTSEKAAIWRAYCNDTDGDEFDPEE